MSQEQLPAATNQEIVGQIQPTLEAAKDLPSDPLGGNLHSSDFHNNTKHERFGDAISRSGSIDIKSTITSIDRIDARVSVPTPNGGEVRYHAYQSEYPYTSAGTVVERPGYNGRIKNPRAVELVASLAAKSIESQIEAKSAETTAKTTV
jgi:hypothetical protein